MHHGAQVGISAENASSASKRYCLVSVYPCLNLEENMSQIGGGNLDTMVHEITT